MKFKSKARRIFKPGSGVDVEFTNGIYSTDDPAEIAVLKHHPLVEVDDTSVTVSFDRVVRTDETAVRTRCPY